MKFFTAILLLLLCTACKSLYFDSFINMYCNNSQAKLIHDADSVQCRSLFDNSLFFILVSSYTCGYCLASFDIFNNIKDQVRSEEHTSELQSRENLVCRLLLEKKNNMYIT